jgi:hypothetical protein
MLKRGGGGVKSGISKLQISGASILCGRHPQLLPFSILLMKITSFLKLMPGLNFPYFGGGRQLFSIRNPLFSEMKSWRPASGFRQKGGCFRIWKRVFGGRSPFRAGRKFPQLGQGRIFLLPVS